MLKRIRIKIRILSAYLQEKCPKLHINCYQFEGLPSNCEWTSNYASNYLHMPIKKGQTLLQEIRPNLNYRVNVHNGFNQL